MEVKEGVIAFLDAVGTKGIWHITETSKVMESWSEVLRKFEEKVEEKNCKYKSDFCKLMAFSDTVIITMTKPPNTGI